MVVFPKTGILDDFNRANENPLSGNWINDALAEGADNQLQIVSNQVKAVTVNTSCEAYYNTVYNGNLEVYFTVITKPGPLERVEMGFLKSPGTGTYSGYQLTCEDVAAGTDALNISRADSGSTTQIGTVAVEYAANDVLGMSITKAGLITVYQNGVKKLSVTDTTYTGDFYLYACIRNTTGVIDNFGGGSYDVRSFNANLNGGVNIRPNAFAPGLAR